MILACATTEKTTLKSASVSDHKPPIPRAKHVLRTFSRCTMCNKILFHRVTLQSRTMNTELNGTSRNVVSQGMVRGILEADWRRSARDLSCERAANFAFLLPLWQADLIANLFRRNICLHRPYLRRQTDSINMSSSFLELCLKFQERCASMDIG
jgi:hypothetical protein